MFCPELRQYWRHGHDDMGRERAVSPGERGHICPTKRQMRRIDPTRVHVATRGTSRQINRQIALTLISSHQPISRADLARRMKMRRGAVGLLVQELLEERHIVEGTTGQIARGRRPTLLYINTRQRSSVAVDVRASRTFLMLADPMAARA